MMAWGQFDPLAFKRPYPRLWDARIRLLRSLVVGVLPIEPLSELFVSVLVGGFVRLDLACPGRFERVVELVKESVDRRELLGGVGRVAGELGPWAGGFAPRLVRLCDKRVKVGGNLICRLIV